jgi:hypothetical protein
MNKLSEAEKNLNAALCNFLNSASDPFPPASDWDDEVRRLKKELSKAYNVWYVWLKNNGRDPFC